MLAFSGVFLDNLSKIENKIHGGSSELRFVGRLFQGDVVDPDPPFGSRLMANSEVSEVCGTAWCLMLGCPRKLG